MSISPRAGAAQAFGRLTALPGMTPAIPFMATAVLLLPLLGVGAAFAAPSLARGNFRAWEVLATNHLATLGWGTLAAMGALYQLFPAVLGASTRPDRWAGLQWLLAVMGMGLVVGGFLGRRIPWVVVGGIVSVISVGLFAGLLMRAIPRRRRWPLPATGIALSVAYLLVTVSWGLLLGINLHHRFWPSLFGYAGVGTHAVLGLIGWFVQLVVSVSYFLLPRFMHVREIGDGLLRPILWLLNAAILLIVWGAGAGNPGAAGFGIGLLSIAGMVYAVDLFRFLRGTRDQKPDLTTYHWWAIWALTIILSVSGLAWAAGALPVEGFRLASAAGVLLLLGWISLAIMGQLYKVTPFLMWFYRYARGLTPFEVPRLAAPYFPRVGLPAFLFNLAGGLSIGLAVLLREPRLGVGGGLLLLAGGLVFWYLMALSWIRAAFRESLSR